MAKRTLLTLWLCLLLVSNAAAAVETYAVKAATSELHFEVDSTLHNIHGKAEAFSGRVTFDKESGRVILPMRLDIPVTGLDTGNAKRDKAMRKMFEVERYPTIQWSAREVSCSASAVANVLQCQVEGTLKIRDIQRATDFSVRLTSHGDSLVAEGRWQLERDDFELKTPSVLGIIRVAQPVSIRFKTLWEKGTAT